MAWRIEEQVVHGEIDNRTPGRVIGKTWLVGRDEAVELVEFYKFKQPFPWHWGNSLYLEWFSVTNGRVVIEAAHYQLELDAEPAWIMRGEDETAQQSANAAAMTDFMGQLGIAVAAAEVEDDDDDSPQSQEEAQADVQDVHPLREIVNSVSSASAKLGGALVEEWPPNRLIAGNVIVRLKKARGYLRDALGALDSAEDEALATPKWWHQTQFKVSDILAQTETLLREARGVLDVADDDDLGIFFEDQKQASQ